jgi:hypothetical protein
MALKGNDISSQTSTTNVDKKISVGGNGDITALQDNVFNLNGAGSLNLTSGSTEVAKAAIAAGQEAIKTAAASADAVVQSQAQFVATASGQKYIVYVVAAVGGLALLGLGYVASKGSK